MRKLLLGLIHYYQRNGGGDRLRVDCNFEPTCSEYTRQAIIRFGSFRGLRLGIQRIRRCNCPDQLHRVFDPVPDLVNNKSN